MYKDALRLIIEFESFSETPYKLPGEPYFTIGYGRHEESIKPSDVVTKADELKWLNARVERTAKLIKSKVKPNLSDSQINALISFIYNVGEGAFSSSTLLKRINKGDPKASEELLRWNKGSHGKVMKGLVRRRKSEKALYDSVNLSKSTNMSEEFKLCRAAKYTKGDLKHQNDAWQWLQSQIDVELIEQFIGMYREKKNETVPPEELNNTVMLHLRYLSQRDNKGDVNKDGKPDWYQTCNVTSCAMIINYLTGDNITATELDKAVYSRHGSRYNHANLVKLMRDYGVKSKFSTTTSIDSIVKHLQSGQPVIWSNKLTHGGHIVALGGVDIDRQRFYVYDPYGEPFPANSSYTKWSYKDVRKPYWLSFKSFNTVSMNGRGNKSHWAHLCSI